MVEIRNAVKEDIPRILEIYTPYITNTTVSFEYTVPTLEQFTSRFEDITAQFPWIVCEIDGKVAGYAYASKAFARAAYQWNADISVYIDDKYHRRGIGSAFYNCIEQLLQMQGYLKAFAIVTGENDSSISFHNSIGYTSFAVYKNVGYKLGKWLDVIWLEKNINEFTDNPKPPVAFSLLDNNSVEKIMLECAEYIK